MSFPQDVRIVLVEPESPGNVGAAARAMKTMGLSSLWLVRPRCDPLDPEALRLAHNAEDVLSAARVTESLELALADTVFSAATTQRRRRAGVPSFTARELAPRAAEAAVTGAVGLVFGRESSGLTNEELSRCSAVTTIPAAVNLPSLNLAQAVMIYCHELYLASQSSQAARQSWTPAPRGEVEDFYAHLERTLREVGARPAVSWEAYLEKFRRVFNRAPLESRDVKLLHKLLETVDEYVERRGAEDRRETRR